MCVSSESLVEIKARKKRRSSAPEVVPRGASLKTPDDKVSILI